MFLPERQKPPMGPTGPREMDGSLNLLQINYYKLTIVRLHYKWSYCKWSFVEWFWENGPSAPWNGRAFGPCGAKRRDYKIPYKTTFLDALQKMAAIFGFRLIRHKGFSERGKKVHFWKFSFQKVFQNTDFWNFAAIFVYIQYMNGFKIVTKRYYNM